LDKLGLQLVDSRNKLQDGRFASNTRLDTGAKPIQIWVIPTDEELSIAQQTAGVLASMQ
jgi:acetate kinase